MLIPVSIYSVVIYVTQYLTKTQHNFKTLFTGLVFVTLPLAFAYHLAHNLNHMLRESVGASQLLYNPLGSGALAPAIADNLLKEYNMLISQDALFAIQAMLMMFGFWIALRVLRYRAHRLSLTTALSISPMLLFIICVNTFNLWMLSQPMVMRLGLCIAPDLTLN